MEEKKEAWFKEWFNSPYYHILYKDRDHKEAEDFITNISSFLGIQPNEKVLDLACGMGRHAIHLNSLGFDVLGADLSEANIEEASKYSNPQLQFVQHDMRDVMDGAKFNYILNLFTSFGYFDDVAENKKVLMAAREMLVTGGCFIIDFFNSNLVIKKLLPFEEKNIENISFKIHKSHNDTHVFKTIQFTDFGRTFSFQEKVQTFSISQFRIMLSECGFEILNIFGDYQLSPFRLEDSPRLILVCKKSLH